MRLFEKLTIGVSIFFLVILPLVFLLDVGLGVGDVYGVQHKIQTSRYHMTALEGALLFAGIVSWPLVRRGRRRLALATMSLPLLVVVFIQLDADFYDSNVMACEERLLTICANGGNMSAFQRPDLFCLESSQGL